MESHLNNENMIKDFNEFSNWLNPILEENLPENTVSINFNLYEGSDDTYHIQIIGSPLYYKDDDEWACYEVFTSSENFCIIHRSEDIKHWEHGLIYITKLVENYLEIGKYKDLLKQYRVIGIGFVDGDIDILYEKN